MFFVLLNTDGRIWANLDMDIDVEAKPERKKWKNHDLQGGGTGRWRWGEWVQEKGGGDGES